PVEPTAVGKPIMPGVPRHSRDVRFENIVYRYPNADRNAVDSVSITVPFWSSVAIVEPNGSGKTTMLNMVVRLTDPSQGRVLVDGIDIAHADLRSLRAQSAVVTQTSVLFEGSIADNISYGELLPDRHRIIEAAKAAFADEFIATLPDG